MPSPRRHIVVLLLPAVGLLACHPSGDDGGPDARADASGDADTGWDGARDGDPDDSDPDDGGLSDADGQVDADQPPRLLVAVYDDTAEPDGSAWPAGLEQIEASLELEGIDHERLSRAELVEDADDPLSRFDGVVFGGGFAYPGYTLGITEEGKGRLLRFVEAGGVFVGICAGAYFACDDIVYEGDPWGDESGYDADLFPGTCRGPLATISSYPDFAVAEVLLEPHPAMAALSEEAAPLPIWYAGGPWFDSADPAVERLASYAGDGLEEEGAAAAVAVPRGLGWVVLFGPHPEVEGDPVPESTRRLLGLAIRWASE